MNKQQRKRENAQPRAVDAAAAKARGTRLRPALHRLRRDALNKRVSGALQIKVRHGAAKNVVQRRTQVAVRSHTRFDKPQPYGRCQTDTEQRKSAPDCTVMVRNVLATTVSNVCVPCMLTNRPGATQPVLWLAHALQEKPPQSTPSSSPSRTPLAQRASHDGHQCVRTLSAPTALLHDALVSCVVVVGAGNH